MPIRLNLLAETQAQEDLRRRDPVKRAVWISGFLVFVVVAMGVVFQFRILSASSKLKKLEAHLGSQTNQFQQIIENQKRLLEISQKLSSLHQLATNRFLMASVLNALQQTTVPDVHLTQLKVAQNYVQTEGAEAKTNDKGKLQPARPATVTESIALTLDARDNSNPYPGSQIDKFKAAIGDLPYFQQTIGGAGGLQLKSLLPPVTDTASGRAYRQFQLECRLPDKTRK